MQYSRLLLFALSTTLYATLVACQNNGKRTTQFANSTKVVTKPCCHKLNQLMKAWEDTTTNYFDQEILLKALQDSSALSLPISYSI